MLLTVARLVVCIVANCKILQPEIDENKVLYSVLYFEIKESGAPFQLTEVTSDGFLLYFAMRVDLLL